MRILRNITPSGTRFVTKLSGKCAKYSGAMDQTEKETVERGCWTNRIAKIARDEKPQASSGQISQTLERQLDIYLTEGTVVGKTGSKALPERGKGKKRKQ